MEIVEIVLSFVEKIREYLVPTFGEHIGYLISYKKNITEVKEHYQKLVLKKEAVQQSIEEADWNQEVTAREVLAWKTNVDKRIEEFRRFEEDVNASTMCLNGRCRNLSFRYSLGVQSCCSIGNGTTSNGRFKNFESRRTKINQVLEALRDDKINIIAICGMGGIGKTEMAKEIAKRVKSDNLFDKVAIAVVSQNPNLKEIQAEIAEHLGPKLDQESLIGRATQLRSRLAKSEKVLIILDDVWEPLDLEAIGICYGDNDNSKKILLTSRNEESCIQMKTQKIFPIELLSKEEAWNFFIETVGDSCIGTPSLQKKVKMVEEECGRLPIAIATIGSAMRNNNDENDWDVALEQLKKSIPQHIPSLHPKVYASIEFSYIHLKSEEAKSCFLLCCLFPEDYDIPIEDLVRYGVGRRLFENIDTIAEARRRVHAIVHSIKRSNLLLDSGKKAFIKMHDIVRDVAISIASRDEHGFLVRCDVGLEEWPQKDTYECFAAISLTLGKTAKHPEGLNCPRLQLLQLSSFDSRLRSVYTFPPNIFDGMKELSVLSLESMPLERLLPSIQVLKNLRMLKLDNSRILINVSAIGALEKLEMLSFCDCSIREVPEEIGNLKQLKLLDLSRCYSLKRIAAGVLSRLCRLEELYTDGFDNWEATKVKGGGTYNASLAEIILYSHQMTALRISLPSIKFLPQDLHFRNQKMKFRISIAPMLSYHSITTNHQISKKGYFSEDELTLHGDARDIVEKRANIAPLLDKSQVLYLNIKSSKNILHDLDRKCFPCLKKLEVKECEDVEYLLDVRPNDTLHVAAFPLLESLELDQLANLKEIYHSKVSERPFSSRGALNNLRSLQLVDCDILKYVFSIPIASTLVQIQNLNIRSCRNIEQIFSLEGGEHKKVFFEMKLPKLTNILLWNLPILNDFCKAMDPIDQHPQSTTQTSFGVYQEIKGSGSEVTSVSHKLFSSNTILWIPNLKELGVFNSHMLQVLFNLEGQRVKEDWTLSQLTTLHLENLSALTHVWKNIPQGFQGFHNLMEIRIGNCHNLTYLFTIQREQEDGEEREAMIIVFPKLSFFEQISAPNFVGFIMEACTIKLPFVKSIRLENCPKLKTLGSETQRRRKPKKMDTKLDSRAQGSSIVQDSPDFVRGCLESCVPHRKNYKPMVVSKQSIIKRSKGSSSIGRTKHYNHGHIPNDPTSTEVTLTNQEQNVTEETDDQVKIWSLIPSNLVESLQNLENLDVNACDLLEVIFQLEGLHVEESLVIDNLKKLYLASLPKLLHIWKKGPQEIRGFYNLECLEVKRCDSLKYLFSPSVAKLLLKLKEIRVRTCYEMNEILAKEFGDEEKDEVIVFPRVKSLSLKDLPKLECFCNETNALKWPSLKKITAVEDLNANIQHIIKGNVPLTKQEQSITEGTNNQVKIRSLIQPYLIECLQNLEKLEVAAFDLFEVIFQLEGLHVEESLVFNILIELHLAYLPKLLHIWKKGPQEIRGFGNLKFLQVDRCDSLKYLFSPFIAKLLVKLEKMEVTNCNEMEEILAKGLGEELQRDLLIFFPRVNFISLKNLPKLECFCNKANAFEWPSLEKIRITSCNSLKMFVPREMKTPKLQGVYTDDRSKTLQPIVGDLNATIQKMIIK